MTALRFKLSEIARRVGGELQGDGDIEVSGLGDLRAAGPQQIAFVRSNHFLDAAKESGAGALLVVQPLAVDCPQIVVGSPDLAFAKVAQMFFPLPRATRHEIHETALVDPSAVLEEPVRVGPRVVIGAGCRIGAGSVIEAGVVIERGCVLGRSCVIYPNATLRHTVEIGDRVVINSGAVIGSDGFGYAPEGHEWIRIPQLGTVRLADDVEVGANTAIDRATFGATTIGRGTKIDNLVHIGHNCKVGEQTIIAGFSALSGSVEVGDRCMLAGHVVVNGHLSVCSDTQFGGASVLLRSVKKPGRYMGFPLQKFHDFTRTLAAIPKLADLIRQIRSNSAETPAETPAENKAEPGD